MKIVGIIQSFFELTFRVVLAPRAKVLFYYPQHFNRSAEGTNPFFDAMLETCQRHGISYKLIEEPDWGTDKPRNGMAIKGDAFFVLVLVLRKVIFIVHRGNTFFQNEKKVARWVNVLTLGGFRCDTYITISGSMFHLLPNLKNGSRIYDMQHGVLYKGHPTFFDQEHGQKLFPHFYPENLHWLFWGEGYRECFVKGEENILVPKCHCIGYPVRKSAVVERIAEGNTILFSLQFTADWEVAKLERLKKGVILFIDDLKGMGVQVLLKHHPRYNNVIDVSDIYEKYDFVRETKKPLAELAGEIFLHATFNSTTAFEYAEYGIPSYFISFEDCSLDDNLFYKEYGYPLYRDASAREVVERLKEEGCYAEDSMAVRSWYGRFYSGYDENAFLKLVNER